MRPAARLFSLCALILSACDRSGDAPASAAESGAASDSMIKSGIVPGILRLGATPSLQPCGVSSGYSISDPRGALRQLPSELSTDTSGVFALVTLKNGVLEQVLFATREGRDCYLDWSGFDARAQGNEPGWVVEITGTGMKLQRQGGATFNYSGVQTTVASDGTRQSASAAGNRVELRLKPSPCIDTMSGAYYGWTASTTIGNETLHGCGIATR